MSVKGYAKIVENFADCKNRNSTIIKELSLLSNQFNVLLNHNFIF